MRQRSLHIGKIVAFEADDRNAANLKRNHPDVDVINTGVWSEDTDLNFIFGENGTSKILELQEDKKDTICKMNVMGISVCKIDNCSECRDMTFLKMDIEGAELYALRGAEKTILRNHPKLAICIYHSDEDMVRIAEWIHELLPEYRFAVRQHSNSICETVLYARI